MLLSSVHPGVVDTFLVESPIPQFSEHDDQEDIEALKHVALTVEMRMAINFNKVRVKKRVGFKNDYLPSVVGVSHNQTRQQ